MLWQTDTITPAHEHFISYLIKQKLLINTERVQVLPTTKENKIFVLYLPQNEIHELGLMYLNYELLSNGYKTIYLGESVPLSSIKDLKKHFDNITFICYTTVEPSRSEINDYIKDVVKEVLDDTSEFWLMGRMTEFVEKKNHSKNILVINSIQEFIENL